MHNTTCEHKTCNNQIEQANTQGHSMLVVLQCVGLKGYSYYQCDNGSMVDYHTWQHWHCTHEHMIEGVKECINNHHHPDKLTSNIMGTTNVHNIILGAGLRCKMCGASLHTVAYRFCLTHATPYNYVPDNHTDMFSGWCCSFNHARQDVLNTMNNLLPVNGHNNGMEDEIL